MTRTSQSSEARTLSRPLAQRSRQKTELLGREGLMAPLSTRRERKDDDDEEELNLCFPREQTLSV